MKFRYGRDDEEVMGLKLMNESVLCVEQLFPAEQVSPAKPVCKCQVDHLLFTPITNSISRQQSYLLA